MYLQSHLSCSLSIDNTFGRTSKFLSHAEVQLCGCACTAQGVFRERRRIHVINPKLAASRVMEDAHAQGETGHVCYCVLSLLSANVHDVLGHSSCFEKIIRLASYSHNRDPAGP